MSLQTLVKILVHEGDEFMKKVLVMLALAFVLLGCSSSNDGFDSSKDISVVSREDGSGTRSAFIELAGILEKDADGNKKDKTTIEAIIANKTDVVMSNIANDTYAIGYLSLGSLNDTIKAVSIDGVKPSIENIKNDEYKIARPFNIVLNENVDEASNDFIKYILSTDGQAVVEKSGYIAVDSDYAFEKSNITGKITVAGSSSVSPVMEKLKEAYNAINPDVVIEIQTTDSTAGVQAVVDNTANIGMASRAIKDDELELVSNIVIGIDGIVVIVNNDNPLENLSIDDLKKIYVGEIDSWKSVISE